MRRQRGGVERAAIVALPIVLNAILAAYLFAHLESGSLPLLGDGVAPVPFAGSTEQVLLPQSSREKIVNAVQEETGSVYDCEGPWVISGGISVWSCRTVNAVAVMYGLGETGVFRLDVTWFGFDETATQLPAWAAAAFGPWSSGREAAAWVAESVGTAARTRMRGVNVEVDGSEGARTLLIQGATD
jgi:hypothetical protein